MPSIASKIEAFLNELSVDAVEERVVEYVIREVRNGRKLTDALRDPYVRNRLSDEKLAHVLENPEVAQALEEQIASSFKKQEFGFLD
ncbi:MAG: hypothetical protein Kow0067_04040 [Coriobacteriia bacterium]|nr:hypothetical protein [Anaerosomatales bacterium]